MCRSNTDSAFSYSKTTPCSISHHNRRFPQESTDFPVRWFTQCSVKCVHVCVIVFAYTGSESRLLRHVQCRHRLSVDRHHWRLARKIHPQGLEASPPASVVRLTMSHVFVSACVSVCVCSTANNCYFGEYSLNGLQQQRQKCLWLCCFCCCCCCGGGGALGRWPSTPGSRSKSQTTTTTLRAATSTTPAPRRTSLDAACHREWLFLSWSGF